MSKLFATAAANNKKEADLLRSNWHMVGKLTDKKELAGGVVTSEFSNAYDSHQAGLAIARPIVTTKEFRKHYHSDPLSAAPISATIEEKFPYFQNARGNGDCYFNSAFTSILHSCVGNGGKAKILYDNLVELGFENIAGKIFDNDPTQPLTRAKVSTILNEKNDEENLVVQLSKGLLMPVVEEVLTSICQHTKEYLTKMPSYTATRDEKLIDKYIEKLIDGNEGIIDAIKSFTEEQKQFIAEQIDSGMIPVDDIGIYAEALRQGKTPSVMEQNKISSILKKLWPYDVEIISPSTPATFEPERNKHYLINFGDLDGKGKRKDGTHYNVLYSKFDTELLLDINDLKGQIRFNTEKAACGEWLESIQDRYNAQQDKMEKKQSPQPYDILTDNKFGMDIEYRQDLEKMTCDLIKYKAMLDAAKIVVESGLNEIVALRAADYVKARIEIDDGRFNAEFLWKNHEIALDRKKQDMLSNLSEQIGSEQDSFNRINQIYSMCGDEIEALSQSEEILSALIELGRDSSKEILEKRKSSIEQIISIKGSACEKVGKSLSDACQLSSVKLTLDDILNDGFKRPSEVINSSDLGKFLDNKVKRGAIKTALDSYVDPYYVALDAARKDVIEEMIEAYLCDPLPSNALEIKIEIEDEEMFNMAALVEKSIKDNDASRSIMLAQSQLFIHNQISDLENLPHDLAAIDFSEFKESGQTTLIMPFLATFPINTKLGGEANCRCSSSLYIQKVENKYQVAYINPTGDGRIDDIPEHIKEVLLSQLKVDKNSIIPTTNKMSVNKMSVNSSDLEDGSPNMFVDNSSIFLEVVLSDLVYGIVRLSSNEPGELEYVDENNHWETIPDYEEEVSDSFGKKLKKVFNKEIDKLHNEKEGGIPSTVPSVVSAKRVQSGLENII